MRDWETEESDAFYRLVCGILGRAGRFANETVQRTACLRLAVQALVAMALANAAPLKYNATKIDIAKGLLASALTKLSP